jgi:hypothetical protein
MSHLLRRWPVAWQVPDLLWSVHTAVVRPHHADVHRVLTAAPVRRLFYPSTRGAAPRGGSIPMPHPEAETVHEMLEDQPNDSGGS